MGVSIKADSGKIELALYNHIKDVVSPVCDFIKLGHRNSKIQDDKMVYCNSPVQIIDLDPISQTISRIEIYVKKIGGFKDVTTLSQIRDLIIPLIGGVTIDDSYFISLKNEISGDDGDEFNYIFLNLAVTII